MSYHVGYRVAVARLYHRAFFAQHQGTTVREAAGCAITEHRTMHGDRLTVRLDYGDGVGDRFSWQLYTPDELCAEAVSAGLTCIFTGTSFDEQVPASAEAPRMQIVLALPKSDPQ